MWLTFCCSLVTALGAPQWSLKRLYGDEDEPQEHDYCFVRFVLSLFNYHKLAIEYTNYEIEVSIDGGPLFGIPNDHLFTVVDDRIEEVHFNT